MRKQKDDKEEYGLTDNFQWHREAERKWDERADFWNQKSKAMWDEGSRKTIIPFLEKHVANGSSVADIGCGDGYGSYKLYKDGYHVTGVDISTEMVELAKKRLENESMTFIQGDFVDLPFEAESFDAVMAINCIEWTEVPVQALNEVKRVLKPGGKLCIGILGPTAMPRTNSYRRVFGEEVICNTMMPWEFASMAEETGWRIVDGHGVYKREVTEQHLEDLPEELKQALTFMWVFILEK
ncbi:class I SAM-dependent methyltransferase [Thalassobacillus hwangdonensis]|uniref:Class I SAM-dependent methyltransferase n=1 Tax=Thalassobacillus hwangdonensis TaxID=546108 RepID=A0ABW3L0C6_9BACI